MSNANANPEGSFLNEVWSRPLPGGISSMPKNDDTTAKISMISGEYKAIPDRLISQEVCAIYDYKVGVFQGHPAQIANYRDDTNAVVAQHIRYYEKNAKTFKIEKTFRWAGLEKSVTQLFGQHLGSSGRLVITEGEIDAMSVAEVLRAGGKPASWREPVVVASLHNGSTSAKTCLSRSIQWIEGFDDVILFFDQDKSGQEATAEALKIISKVRVVGNFAFKDANEALKNRKPEAIREAIFTASRHRPKAVIHAPDLLSKILQPVNRHGLPFPWTGWNLLTEGMKPGELWLMSGGTGIGKSLFSRSICLSLCKAGVKCAYVGLEESCTTTVERMLSEDLRDADPPFHLQTPEQRELYDQDRIKASYASFKENLFLLDKFGSEDFDQFIATVKYYVLGEGCRVVFLDHFSLLADGIALGTDQRRAIDKCIKDLKTLCVDLGFTMFCVCHLSRDGGYSTPAEEGGEPHLGMLRGSHSLAQIPDYIVMLQRNPNAKFPDGSPDKHEANITRAWLKKNRVKGELGLMSKLFFEKSCVFTELP